MYQLRTAYSFVSEDLADQSDLCRVICAEALRLHRSGTAACTNCASRDCKHRQNLSGNAQNSISTKHTHFEHCISRFGWISQVF